MKFYDYGTYGQMVAECEERGHDRCRLTRTCCRLDSIPAQGRPLAMLCCWLTPPEFIETSHDHVFFYMPEDEERDEMRDYLIEASETDPILKNMLESEAPLRPGERNEPIGIP